MAVVVAGGHLFLRIRTSHRLGLDDAFLIAAVVLFAGSVGLTQRARDLDFIQMDVNTGVAFPSPTFPEDMLLYNKLDTAESMLQWSAIYAVKFSYLLFFRPLISRVKFLETWWWCVMGIVIPSALACVFMSLWVCPYFDFSFLGQFTVKFSRLIADKYQKNASSMGPFSSMKVSFSNSQRPWTFPQTFSVGFISVHGRAKLTKFAVISVPVLLLCKVRLKLQRKLALGVVLCLSIFMIVIASIRLGLCYIPTTDGSTIPDTTWLFFWQALEACTAIIMVSLTAFRSLYGQGRAKKGKGGGYDYVNESSVQRNAARRQIMRPRNSGAHSGSGQGSRSAFSRWEGEDELRAIEMAHTRTNPLHRNWDHRDDRQPSRDKTAPRAMPESFV